MKQTTKKIHASSSQDTPIQKYKLTENFRKAEPDFYVIFQDKIFPLHKLYVKGSSFIQGQFKQNENVLILNIDIQIGVFQKALEFLYDLPYQISRDQVGIKMFNAAQKLGIYTLEEIYLRDFQEKFQEYQFFRLYHTALLFSIPALIQRCEQQLHLFEYEQINFNRLGLLELPNDVFERVIRNHQRLKANKTITGLSIKDIKDAIQSYSNHNDKKMDIDELLKTEYDCFEVNSQLDLNVKIMKTQSLTNSNYQNSVRHKISFQSWELPRNSGNMKIYQQLYRIKSVNEMQEKNNRIFQKDLQKIKKELSKQSQECSGIGKLQQKLKSMQKQCEKNNKKMNFYRKSIEEDVSLIPLQSQSQIMSENSSIMLLEEMKCEQKIKMSTITTNPSTSQTKSSISWGQIPVFEKNPQF